MALTSSNYEELEALRGNDVIDSRELIAALEDYDEAIDPDNDLYTLEEIKEIEADYGALAQEVRDMESCTSDWPYGATLVNEDHFKEYAQQLAEDIGAIDGEAGWPYTCIDWEQAADELRTDYTSVEYGGDTYYVR